MAVTIQSSVSLVPYTTLQVGGVARYFISATTADDIREAVEFAAVENLPVFVLGSGSNILVPDSGFQGVVIHVQLKGYHHDIVDDSVLLTVGAGELLDEVIVETVDRGWWGLENLSAIPGSVGAAPVQNVGAYGVEAADCIESVTVYDIETKSEKVLTNTECQFGYRDSIFKHEAGKRYIVTAVLFRLQLTPSPKLHYADLVTRFSGTCPSMKDIRQVIVDIRSGKFPDWRVVGTAGSFFKNPILPQQQADSLKILYPDLPIYDAGLGFKKISLGYVLDKVCQLKGYCAHGVCLYEKQALVLVTESHASASDVINFAHEVAQRVKEKISVTIEWEVVMMK